MKIRDVRTTHVQVARRESLWSATHQYVHRTLRARSHRSALIVEVETDDGLVGVGQASISPGPAGTTQAVIEQELRPYLIGEDPSFIEGLWARMYRGTLQHGRRGIVIAAMSGVDIALWDLQGKALGQPIYKLLGAYRDRVDAYASAGWYAEGKTVDDLSSEVRALMEQGYRAVKIKIGALPVNEDLGRIRAAREGVGPSRALMVDANRSYDPKTALRMARRLEEFDVAFFEEPVSPDDPDGSAFVAAGTTIPIAGYETEVTRFGYRELIQRRAVDVVQPDVIWAGGISEARKIAEMASAWGLPYIPHSFGSPLTLVANLHLVASLDNGQSVEVDCTDNPLMDGLLLDCPTIGLDGQIPLPSGPGLGVELNRAFIEDYRVPG